MIAQAFILGLVLAAIGIVIGAIVLAIGFVSILVAYNKWYMENEVKKKGKNGDR